MRNGQASDYQQKRNRRKQRAADSLARRIPGAIRLTQPRQTTHGISAHPSLLGNIHPMGTVYTIWQGMSPSGASMNTTLTSMQHLHLKTHFQKEPAKQLSIISKTWRRRTAYYAAVVGAITACSFESLIGTGDPSTIPAYSEDSAV